MTDFKDTWAPTWEVQKTIRGARACIIENTARKFRTGRPIVDVVFFDGNRREICRRSGMRLTSKRGNEYVVCRRDPDDSGAVRHVTTTDGSSFNGEPNAAPPLVRRAHGGHAAYTPADVFDEE